MASCKGNKSYETVSAKTGFCPSHRNFQQSASPVRAHRFKQSGIFTRLLILQVAETLMFYVVFSWRWFINVWQQNKNIVKTYLYGIPKEGKVEIILNMSIQIQMAIQMIRLVNNHNLDFCILIQLQEFSKLALIFILTA